MAEEHSNIQEADDLLKLANKLDTSSTSELEIERYLNVKQNGGVQQALNVVNSCKPFLSKALLIMKLCTWHSYYRKKSNSNVSANF
jgi:hypothetical protein